jgi:hypothetical protein
MTFSYALEIIKTVVCRSIGKKDGYITLVAIMICVPIFLLFLIIPFSLLGRVYFYSVCNDKYTKNTICGLELLIKEYNKSVSLCDLSSSNFFVCAIYGTIIFMLIIILVFCLVISSVCKTDIKESFSQAQELVDIRIENSIEKKKF